jgi:transcriptional regulator with XRE-family HTH domain
VVALMIPDRRGKDNAPEDGDETESTENHIPSTATPEAIGTRITEVRKMRDLTQVELGRLLHPPRSRSAVWGWENAKDRMNFQQLVDVAQALRCSVYYLASGHGSPDVEIYPLKVVMSWGVPVPIVDNPESPQKFVSGLYGSREGDMARTVKDSAMAPEARPGDVATYRPGLQPQPGDMVWARDNRTGEMLRVTAELYPLSDKHVPEDVTDDVEILGTVMQLTRVYRLG